jgi:hypothetical protein
MARYSHFEAQSHLGQALHRDPPLLAIATRTSSGINYPRGQTRWNGKTELALGMLNKTSPWGFNNQ